MQLLDELKEQRLHVSRNRWNLIERLCQVGIFTSTVDGRQEELDVHSVLSYLDLDDIIDIDSNQKSFTVVKISRIDEKENTIVLSCGISLIIMPVRKIVK